MKIRNPFYLAFAVVALSYVAWANHNGWSLVQSVTPASWHGSYPSTQHK